MKKMMRNTTMVVLALLCTSPLWSQESDMDDRKFRFGLHASPNLGWLRPNIQDFEKTGLQPRLGFGYGLMMDFRFSDSPNYLFSTGVNLTTNGGGLVQPYDSLQTPPDTSIYWTGKLDRTYRYQYVNIPLLLKMRTNEIGYMSYFAAVGVDVGIRTRAFANDDYTWKEIPGYNAPPDRNDVNIQSQTQLFRLGINLTGGGEFNLTGNTNLYVGVSYHNHFTNAFRKTDANRILEPAEDGTPKLDDNGMAIIGKHKKAVTNYVALNVGIYF